MAQDHVRASAGRRRRVRCGHNKETVGEARAAGAIIPDDLAGGVDAASLSIEGQGQGIVDREVASAAQKEAVLAAAVVETSDDLARIVDAERLGAIRGQ